MRILKSRSANAYILYDADALCGPVTPELFTKTFWDREDAITGEAPGRGASLFLTPGDHACGTPPEAGWVLRPYKRGGLIAHLSERRYIWTSYLRTRARREFKLTAYLHAQGLAVPQPVGACIWRHGLTYEAALITVRLPDAMTLEACLTTSDDVSYIILRAIGRLIRQAHDIGLDHVDLNARNIMVDAQGKPWLIDLDRCRLHRHGQHWQKRNIERLERSLTRFFPYRAAAVMHEIRQGYRQATRPPSGMLPEKPPRLTE